MTEFYCAECGIPFLIPERLWQWRDGVRRNGGADIFCPNGHAFRYCSIKADKETPREKELLAEIMQLRHQLDQAEARARDDRPAPTPRADADVPEPTMSDPQARFKCEHCGKEYRIEGPYITHMRREHSVTVPRD